MKKIFVFLIAVLVLGAFGPWNVKAQTHRHYYQIEQTTTALSAAGTYTSSVYNVAAFKTVDINVTADQDSAANGVDINFANDTDGSCPSSPPTADYVANGGGWSYTASSKDSYSASVRGNCAWVVYTNGGSNQGSFELTVFFTK